MPNKFENAFEHIGHGLKVALHIGVEAAEVAEPGVDILFPGIALLYNTAVALGASAELISPTGATVEQKTASLITLLVPQVEAWAQKNGIVWDNGKINEWATTIAKTFVLIPPPTVPAK